MQYPIWDLTTLGGGFWIAVIATVHVYVAQFAVGGGLLMVMAEKAAYKQESNALLEYIRFHSKFFLLLSMVFGAVTGVAIWFTIALLSPQGTIVLIHNFVFGWATEWVFFLGEIVALLVYFYGWKRLSREQHTMVGWIYFAFAWLSLFTINGIIGFMLTPGDWLQTKDFWDGFFNPTFWPQLVFRTFLSFMIAGLFGFMTALRIKEDEARTYMVRTCAKWTLLGFAIMVACGVWYVYALPPEQFLLVTAKSHRIGAFMQWFWMSAPLVVCIGLYMAMRVPQRIPYIMGVVILVAGFGLAGSFEYVREAARKPYIIWDHIYSNSILKAEVPAINAKGYLKAAKWVPDNLRTITDKNEVEVGRLLFRHQCSSCHSINGPMNDIVKRTATFSDVFGMDVFLTGMGKINKYMPPFVGKADERKALAAFIVRELHNRKPVKAAVFPDPDLFVKQVNLDKAKYALLAWPNRGMALAAEDKDWVLQPATIGITAQLFLRDDAPEPVTDAKLSWSNEASKAGDKMKALSGDIGLYTAHAIGADNARPSGALPLFKVTAKDADGKVLATAQVGTPIRMAGCASCHTDPKTGKSNILVTHDRMNGTSLVKKAADGKKVECTSCHSDQHNKGRKDLMDISTAIHGLHAVYMQDKGADACASCHGDSMTQGVHREAELNCTNCHGTMENHALALLTAGYKSKSALNLMKLIPPTDIPLESILPRKAWVQQPDCLTCHKEFGDPDGDDAFNRWTAKPEDRYSKRTGDMDIARCTSCHGQAHAIMPAAKMRLNAASLKYTGKATTIGMDKTCTTCHVDDMDDAAHHNGMGLDQ